MDLPREVIVRISTFLPAAAMRAMLEAELVDRRMFLEALRPAIQATLFKCGGIGHVPADYGWSDNWDDDPDYPSYNSVLNNYVRPIIWNLTPGFSQEEADARDLWMQHGGGIFLFLLFYKLVL